MYPAVARDLVKPLIELLRISRDLFDGDIDTALVFYVIAARTVEHEDFRRMTTEEMASGACHPPSLGTNARSVAESLGMPRESARRRVQSLIGAGLVVRCENDLMLSSDGLRALVPVRNFLVELSVRYFQIVSSAIGDAQQPEPAPQARVQGEPRCYPHWEEHPPH